MVLFVTPINFHLAADEAEYIINDCGASVVIASAALTEPIGPVRLATTDPGGRLLIGGSPDDPDSYERALAAQPTHPIADESEGSWMFYSSGTTGKPKGIKPPSVGARWVSPVPSSRW